jgi:hypothetical protein
VTIKASDRTYVVDNRGCLRVLDYHPNGVENSDIYVSQDTPEAEYNGAPSAEDNNV